MKKKKNKATRFHSKWRADADFKKKLSPEERDWYEQFEDEYYRAAFSKTDEPLHSEEQRRELYRQQNAANVDVVTQTSDKVAEHLAKPVKKKGIPNLENRHTYYSPDDYPFSEPGPDKSPEDAIIAAIDADRRRKNQSLS